MQYIIVMTVSGSTMMLLYFMTQALLGRKMTAVWRCRLLKIAMLYFLIPLPFLKGIYLDLLQSVYADRQHGTEEVVIASSEKSLIFFDGENYYANTALQRQILVIGIWIFVAGIIMLWKIMQYLKARKLLTACRGMQEDEKDCRLLERCKTDYGIRRKVLCLRYPEQTSGTKAVFTFGLWKPVIIWTTVATEAMQEVVLRHELQHIRRCDTLWKMLATCARVIHWFNPFAWWLEEELETACEMVCDEAVLEKESEEVKNAYISLVLALAQRRGEKNGRLGWTFSLSQEGKRIKARILNMKSKRNYWKKAACFLTVAAITMLNSLTVLAYEDVQCWRGDSSYAEIFMEGDYIFIENIANEADKEVLKETFSEVFDIEIVYDFQFEDEMGNIYPSNEEQAKLYADCVHRRAVGTATEYVKHSGGGCTITEYLAERCTKCRETVVGEKINSMTLEKCTH